LILTHPLDEPKPIGEIIDEAIREILGTAGNEFYAELIRQTTETRDRIDREVRSRFREVFEEVFRELTGFEMKPRTLETAARIEIHRRLQAEIARRISEEEQAFRKRVNRLYSWSQRRSEHQPDG
jgi:hypothetical protein